MSDLKIHHIGYLVKNIDKAADQFEFLGFSIINEKCRDDHRQADILFMEKDGVTIELVSPVSEESVVAGLIKRYKNSPYHICYESEDIEADAEKLTSKGFTAIDEPTPAPAIGGRRVQFFMGHSVGMIELVEAL